jgi:uncharacterized membrane protein
VAITRKMSSTKSIQSTPSDVSAKKTRWRGLVQLLLTVAMCGATYLAWVSFQNGPVAGCGPGSGCSKVLQSRWAYWLGIPVSVPAVLAYMGLLATTFCLDRRRIPAWHLRAWAVVLVLSVVISGAAVWFIGLQAIVLKSFCKFCMVAHTCALVATTILLRKAPIHRTTASGKPAQSDGSDGRVHPSMPKPVAAWCALVGLGGVAVLIAGQLLVEKKRFVVASVSVVQATHPPLRLPANLAARIPQSNTLASAFVTRSNNSMQPSLVVNPANPAALLVRRTGLQQISVHDDLFQFQLNEIPIIGSPDAQHVMVSLFDYTCPHCRDLHPMLIEAQRHFSNQLGIVLLATPLASNCNPVVQIHLPEHTNACEYARLALAVWRARREAFRQYDNWLFEPPRPVPVPEAKRYAAQLVGADNLERALADAWILNHIQTNGYLYKTNYLRLKNSVLPELMIGSVVSFGPLNNPKDLADLLSDHLGLKR